MRVHRVGDGDPSVAIVGGIHGDEPCGVRAIDRLVSEDLPVEAPVKFIVANEEALSRGRRFVDTDLNRAFDDRSDGVEQRLAARLAEELAGCLTLSIHSTQSTDDPFAFVASTADSVTDICQRLPITALVVIEEFEGRPFALDATELIEVEAGRQGTPRAAENAYRIARAFLGATGVLPEPIETRELPVFRLDDPIPKPDADRYEVFVENFERVEPGEVFAAADGRELAADRPFYPILLSAYGYEEQFGYYGDRIGRLDP